MWVASKISGTAGALGAEAIELINWILCLGCASEELRVVVTRLSDWMDNSSSPRASNCSLMACCFLALDKRPGVRPLVIGETLHWALEKLVMREAGDQEKTVCDNPQLCAGLEAVIEGATYAVLHRQLERARHRSSEDEARRPDEEEDKEEAVREDRLTVET